MRAACLAAFVIGCGGNAATKPDAAHDAAVDAYRIIECGCNPAAQTGCPASEKCTWVVDSTSPPLGHIGCAPDGSVSLGSACTVAPPGPSMGSDGCLGGMGYDNCVHGAICTAGKCKSICDPSQGLVACSQGLACALTANTFVVNTTITYGSCEATCDPLADNAFGKGTKSGTMCAVDEGCYGLPDLGAQPPSYYVCMHDDHPTAFQGTQVATPSILNSCAQGFVPFYYESETVMTRVCTSFCAPANCYAGNCGATGMNYAGVSPHACNTTDSSGTFDMTSGGSSCHFSWDYEWDQMTLPQSMTFIRSLHSDTLGFCQDHAAFKYASQPGSGVYDTAIPGCDQIALRGFGDHTVHPPSSGTTCPNNAATCCQTTNGCLGAADFGCVDSSSAGLPFAGKPAVGIVQRPRAL